MLVDLVSRNGNHKSRTRSLGQRRGGPACKTCVHSCRQTAMHRRLIVRSCDVSDKRIGRSYSYLSRMRSALADGAALHITCIHNVAASGERVSGGVPQGHGARALQRNRLARRFCHRRRGWLPTTTPPPRQRCPCEGPSKLGPSFQRPSAGSEAAPTRDRPVPAGEVHVLPCKGRVVS